MNINALIVEDELKGALALEDMLKRHCPEVSVNAKARNVTEAVKLIEETKPELVFLDIELPDGYGFDVLEQTNHLKYQVVFTTAYHQYAIKAFAFSALHYLLKPIDPSDLKNAVSRFMSQASDNNGVSGNQLNVLKQGLQNEFTKMAIHTSDGVNLIEIKLILRMEASGSYTNIFMKSGQKIIVSKNLKRLNEQLNAHDFTRVHDKHLINMAYIKKYIPGRGGHVVMEDETLIPISIRRKELFLDALSNYSV